MIRRQTVRVLAAIWRRLPKFLRGVVLWVMVPKMMIGVSGVLLNERNDVLLLHHRFHPEEPWGLPGGWLDRGELVTEGWRREVWEETGLTVHVSGFVAERKTATSVEFILLGRLSGGTLTVQQAEINDARFFPVDQLPDGLQEDHAHAIRHVMDHGMDQPSAEQDRPLLQLS